VSLKNDRIASIKQNSIQIWDTLSGEGLAQLCGHRDQISALAVLPNGNLLSAETRLCAFGTPTSISRLRLRDV
jgi:hypothetical protein